MHKVKNEQTPQIFRTVFSVTNNKYNTQSCRRLTFSKTLHKTTTTQYNIYFIPTELKDLTFPIFKSKIKTLCFGTSNERNTALLKCTYH